MAGLFIFSNPQTFSLILSKKPSEKSNKLIENWKLKKKLKLINLWNES